MNKLITATVLIIVFSSCNDVKDDGRNYNNSYIISSIPGKDDFLKMNEHELALDSMFNSVDKELDSLYSSDPDLNKSNRINQYLFSKNRSRIFMRRFENGRPVKTDTSFTIGSPAMCACLVKNDSLFVSTGIGFFGGIFFEIAADKKHFISKYDIYTDDVRPYKANLSDSFSSAVSVDSRYQYLVFDKAPSFRAGQQLTGYLTLTSKPYYENQIGERLDTGYVESKIFFTCITRDEKNESGKWQLNR